MEAYTFDTDELTENCNTAKEDVLNRLYKDGLLTQEQAKEYAEKWNIIIFESSLFGKWKDKFFNNKTGLLMKYVRFED